MSMTPVENIKEAIEVEKAAENPKNQEAAKQRTTGEKWFNGVRFAVAETVILVATAAIAYVANYGKDSYRVGGTEVPNYLKKFQVWMRDKMTSSKFFSEKGEFGVRLAGAVASSTVLMHGGNLFAPVMKWMEDKKANIVNFFNKHLGKPGELEEGKERIKEQVKQTWGDIIKGRALSWIVVFTSFFSADMLLGKDASGMRRFDKFEDKFGKWVAGFTKAGKDAGANLSGNNAYRFGKILALDIFATTAAIAIWNSVSKFSAMMRRKKGTYAHDVAADVARDELAVKKGIAPAEDAPDAPAQETQRTSYTSRQGKRPDNYQALAADRAAASSSMAVS